MLEKIIRTCEALPIPEAAEALEKAQHYFKIRACEAKNWEYVCKDNGDRVCNSCQNGYKKLPDIQPKPLYT